MADLLEQYKWSVATEGYLGDMVKQVKRLGSEYEGMIMALKQNHYFKQFIDNLEKEQQQFQTELDSLESYILKDHLSYIETQTNALLETIKKHVD